MCLTISGTIHWTFIKFTPTILLGPETPDSVI